MRRTHPTPSHTYVAFVRAASRYWTSAHPTAAREIRRLEQRATTIPDPALRAAALSNLRDERGNLEGAAAFAVLAGRRHRGSLTAALVTFQAIYDYIDTLVEADDRTAGDARRIHQALRHAVGTGPHDRGTYFGAAGDDGGYLEELVERCRTMVGRLPGAAAVAPLTAQATAAMVEYQVYNHLPGDVERAALAAWSSETTPAGAALEWWENASASASSLVVFALLAQAATGSPRPEAARAIVTAYRPIGALHVLLDSLADREADARTGHHNLIAHYATAEEATRRLAAIAAAANSAARQLPDGTTHNVICAAMAAFYLAGSDARTASAVSTSLGAAAKPALFVLRARKRRRHAGDGGGGDSADNG